MALKVSNKSPLSFGERAKLSFADDGGLKSVAESKGYKYAKNKKTGEKYFQQGDTLYRLDEQGFGIGDVADLSNEATNIGVAIPTFAATTIAGGGIPGAIVGGAVSGAAGASAERGIGHLLGVRNSSLGQEAMGVGTEAAVGGVTAGLFKGLTPIVNKGISSVSSKLGSAGETGSKFINKIIGKGKDVLLENKENTFLKNLGFKSKNPAFSEQETQQAEAIAKKYLKLEDTPKIMREKLTVVRDANAAFIKKAIDKVKEIVPIEKYETLRQKLNEVVTKNPQNAQLTRFLKEFDDRWVKATDKNGISGKEFRNVLEWVGDKGRQFSDFEAKQAVNNVKNVLKGYLPKDLQNKYLEDYTIANILRGVTKGAEKEISSMSRDTLTNIGKIGGNVTKALGIKEILDMTRK